MLKSPPSKGLSLHLNVLVERRDDYFEAHCLELDIVSDGANADVAIKNLLDCVRAQLSVCLEMGDLDNLFRPAPKEYWDRLAHARAATEGCRSKRTTSRLPSRYSNFSRLEVDQFCYA